MKGLVNYLEEMYKQCKIPFDLYVDGENIFKANPDLTMNDIVESKFLLGSNSCMIQTEKKYAEFLKIFIFCIENKYKEHYNVREKVIIELLENAYVSKEKIKEVMLPLQQQTYLINISLKDKLAESLEILKNIYDTNIVIVRYKKSLILIGTFEDVDEHMSSIKETLEISAGENCYISYCHIDNYEKLKSLYDDTVYNINLAKKYNISNNIFSANDLVFEKVIDNLTENVKQDIVAKFNKGFSELDGDIIKTIDVFLSSDLNLSEAAKKLYVHRNTLIYRLDKIQKHTSYDIRKFNEAVVFKIAFFLWKGRI